MRGPIAALVAALIWFGPSAALARQVRIVVTGDSNIEGKGVSLSDAYPAQLERALRAKGLDVTVLNTGRNGDVTAGLMRRLDSAVPQGTDLVIFTIGINDLTRGEPLEYVREMNGKIRDTLKARGMEVMLFGPNQPLKNFQDGISEDPDFHVEKVNRPSQFHLNAQGYAHVVKRTLPIIMPVVKKLAARK
ncbi:MAG: arylesterase [Hyphomicrobiales bacterium]|nr:arylesterase [Hyphomicrobiales bacterium]